MTEQQTASAEAIGARLRQLRIDAGMSLRAVAERIGISSSALSQIEKGVMRPSVNRLVEIVTVLEVPVSAIFDDNDVFRPTPIEDGRSTEPIPGVTVHTGSGAGTVLGQGVVYRRLTPVRVDGADLYETIYPPMTSSSIDGAMLVHSGFESGYVIRGTLRFEFSEGTVELGPGESLAFWASRPHRVVNESADEEAAAIWMTLTNRAQPSGPQE